MTLISTFGRSPKAQSESSAEHEARLRLKRRNGAENDERKRHQGPLEHIERVVPRLEPLRLRREKNDAQDRGARDAEHGKVHHPARDLRQAVGKKRKIERRSAQNDRKPAQGKDKKGIRRPGPERLEL